MVVKDFRINFGDDISDCVKLIYESNPHPRQSWSKVNENHIWDEEKSVRWNREECKRHNDKVHEAIHNYHRDISESYVHLTNAIHEYIKDYLRRNGIDISELTAKKLWDGVCVIWDEDKRHLYLDDILDLMVTFHK